AFPKESGLSRLNKGCDVVFLSINDAADQALYPVGVLGFCASDAEKVYINTDSVKGRAAYSADWEANRSTLRGITESFKIPLIELSTESEIQRDLVLGLKNIAKRKRCLL